MNNCEDVKKILAINNIIILLCHPLFILTGAAIQHDNYLAELGIASFGGLINGIFVGGTLTLVPNLQAYPLRDARSKKIAAIFILACGFTEIISAGLTGKGTLEKQYAQDISINKLLSHELIGLTIVLTAVMTSIISGYGLYKLGRYGYGRFFPNHAAVVIDQDLNATEEHTDNLTSLPTSEVAGQNSPQDFFA